MKSQLSLFKNLLCTCSCDNAGIGQALMRIGVGLVFLAAGIFKILSLNATAFMFAQIGLPSWLVYFVIAVEVIGGLLLIVGLWNRIASIFLGITMLVAMIITLRYGGGFMGALAPFVLILTMIQIYFAPAGMWSLDRRLGCCVCKKKSSKESMVSMGGGVGSSKCESCDSGTCCNGEDCSGCDCN